MTTLCLLCLILGCILFLVDHLRELTPDANLFLF